MNQLTPSSHDEIFLLLPWYVNQTLNESEHAKVSSHLANCKTCSAEIEFLTQVEQVAANQDDVRAIPQNGFARLMQEIDQDETGVFKQKAGGFAENIAQWLRFDWFGARGLSMAVPAILVLTIAGGWFWSNTPTEDATYRTLTTPGPSDKDAMQFKVELAEDAEAKLLQEYFRDVWGTGVSITLSPDGGYTFQLPDDADTAKTTKLLKILKSSESIKSVELVVD